MPQKSKFARVAVVLALVFGALSAEAGRRQFYCCPAPAPMVTATPIVTAPFATAPFVSSARTEAVERRLTRQSDLEEQVLRLQQIVEVLVDRVSDRSIPREVPREPLLPLPQLEEPIPPRPLRQLEQALPPLPPLSPTSGSTSAVSLDRLTQTQAQLQAHQAAGARLRKECLRAIEDLEAARAADAVRAAVEAKRVAELIAALKASLPAAGPGAEVIPNPAPGAK